MDLELEGRVALVTGASRGIGLAIVEALAAEGARVAAVSRTRSEELDAIAGEVIHVAADLSRPEAPAAAVAATVERLDGLDVLVNNAGGPAPDASLPHEGFLSRSDAEWQAIFELNLFSAVRATRAAVTPMRERGGGAVVNVASGNARSPLPFNLDYSAAKAALLSFGKALAEELAPDGIRINAVSPGATMTPWWTDEGGVGDQFAAQAGTSREEALGRVVPESIGHLTGRMIEPREVADAVALLASPRSASTTGAEFVVDAGANRSL